MSLVRYFSMLGWAALLFASVECNAQVDPVWLTSWTEALKTRPEELSSHSRIASVEEPGEPMAVYGTVVTPSGQPARDVVVLAYHRDQEGFEYGSKDSVLKTWKLQGWAKTNKLGKFTFETIRPAADHLGREAAHIHFTLESEEYGRQWAPSFFLADDPLVPERLRKESQTRGSFGRVSEVVRDEQKLKIYISIQLKEKPDF